MSEKKEYDLGASAAHIGQLLPVVVAADGELLDGKHRRDVDKNWGKEPLRLANIKTPLQKAVGRLVLNLQRRSVGEDEKRDAVAQIASELSKDPSGDVKISRKTLARKLATITGMSIQWVYKYLPDEFKGGKSVPHRRTKSKPLTPRRAQTTTMHEPELTESPEKPKPIQIRFTATCPNCHEPIVLSQEELREV